MNPIFSEICEICKPPGAEFGQVVDTVSYGACVRWPVGAKALGYTYQSSCCAAFV